MSHPFRARSRSTNATSAASARESGGRGAAGKVAVFGILKRGGRVYTKMILDSRRTTIIPIIQAKVEPDSIVFSDSFATYDVLDVAGFHHHRVNHQETFVLGPGKHINGIENFWSQAKRHLRRYNGIPKGHFHLFLKECEWRFNYGTPRDLLRTPKPWIKNQSPRTALSLKDMRSAEVNRFPSDQLVATQSSLNNSLCYDSRRAQLKFISVHFIGGHRQDGLERRRRVEALH